MIQAEAEKLFYLATNKLQAGDVPAAVDLLSDLTSRFADFGKAYNYLGEIYFLNFKDSATAELHFKKAISTSPEYTATYISYSKLLLVQERFAEMNANLNKASEIAGVKKNELNEQFGFMNELQGKYDDAIVFFKKAITYTFSEVELADYEKSINRCNLKKKYI